MIRFIGKRCVFIVLSLFVASLLVFVITAVIPGDVAQMILGQFATPRSLEALRENLGLNRPGYVRYFEWITRFVQGDMGTSLSMPGVSVSSLVLRRGKNSLILAGAAALFLIPVSLVLGVIAGLSEGKWPDTIISTVTLISISLPEFISGIFLMIIFSVWFGILPATSSIDPRFSLWNQLSLLILPGITVSLVLLGYVGRMVRASVIETSRADFTRTAVLKGLSHRRVVIKHILRNALLPTVTVIAMNLGWLFGGIIIVEEVFGFPGLGNLVLFAIRQRDIPMIQAVVLIMGAAYLVLNLLADILYTLINPRIRY